MENNTLAKEFSVKYGIIAEKEDMDLWFEPITDTIDGFVIRDKQGSILVVFYV